MDLFIPIFGDFPKSSSPKKVRLIVGSPRLVAKSPLLSKYTEFLSGNLISGPSYKATVVLK